MSLPPISGRPQQFTATQSQDSDPIDTTQPKLSSENNQTPQTPLGKRKANTTDATKAKASKELSNQFIQQTLKVEALETRLKLATEAERFSQRLQKPSIKGMDDEVLVVHVGVNGKFLSVIPPENKLLDSANAKSVKDHVARQFQSIHQACKDKLPQFREELVKEQAKLAESRLRLIEMGQLPPDIELGYRGINIDLAIQDTPPPLLPAIPKTLDQCSEEFEPETTIFCQSRHPRPEVKNPSRESEPLIIFDDDNPPSSPLQPAAYPDTEKAVTQNLQLLNAGEALLYEPTASTVFVDPSKPKVGLDSQSKGDMCVLLQRKKPGAEARDSIYKHSARKALLFPVFINLMKSCGHRYAVDFPDQAVPLYQMALAAAEPNPNQCLEGAGSDSDRAHLTEILTQYEGVKPELAEVIARDVSGTHKVGGDGVFHETLAATIIRDIERLEQARSAEALNIEDFEVYKKTRDNPEMESSLKTSLHMLSKTWLELCAVQGELSVCCDIRYQGRPLDFISTSDQVETLVSTSHDTDRHYTSQQSAMIVGDIKRLFDGS